MRASSDRRRQQHPAPDADARFARFLTAAAHEQGTHLAVITPFTPRFATNATGYIAIVGNMVMTALASDPSAVNAQNGVGSKIDNNDFNMAFVDVHQDSTTFDAGSATLSLSAGASVLFAGLFRGGRDPQASLRTRVKLLTPSSAGYLRFSGSLIGTSTTSDGIGLRVLRQRDIAGRRGRQRDPHDRQRPG